MSTYTLSSHFARVLKGLILPAVLFLGLFMGCEKKTPQAITETDFALGTTCSVKLFGSEYRDRLKPSLEIAKTVEERMSVNLEDSEISRINRAAGNLAVSVSDETFGLLERAVEFAEMGQGAFDPTIGPLVSLWDIGSGDESVPEPEAIKEALGLVNFRLVRLEKSGDKVFLEKSGMTLDLGAIAKGYAADLMVDYLRARKVPAGIVNLGGNVYAFGRKPAGGPWKIGIQSPYDDRGTYIGIAEIDEGAVVTSGKYERFFIENGIRYHHILSTQNGYPVENGLASVTIISSDATAADALSTLIFTKGLEKGLKLAESLENVEAVIITEEKKVFTTSGIRESFRLTDDDFQPGAPLSSTGE